MDKHVTIGQRAALAIRKRVRFGRVKPELDRMQIPQGTFSRWKTGKGDPQAYCLQQMALSGYDVQWILTGERSNHVTENNPEILEYEEEL